MNYRVQAAAIAAERDERVLAAKAAKAQAAERARRRVEEIMVAKTDAVEAARRHGEQVVEAKAWARDAMVALKTERDRECHRLRADGMVAEDIAATVGVPCATVYEILLDPERRAARNQRRRNYWHERKLRAV